MKLVVEAGAEPDRVTGTTYDGLNRKIKEELLDPGGGFDERDALGQKLATMAYLSQRKNTLEQFREEQWIAEEDATFAHDPSRYGELRAALPWYKQWWYNSQARLENREPLIRDPRGYEEFTIGDRLYVTPNDTGNESVITSVIGDLYHGVPFVDLAETGLRFATDPVGEAWAQAQDAGSLIVNLPRPPEVWEEVPDYQEQDVAIKGLLETAAGTPSVAKITRLSKLHMAEHMRLPEALKFEITIDRSTLSMSGFGGIKL